MVQSRSMLDVSYAGSSLVGEYPAGTLTPMTRLLVTVTRTGRAGRPGHHLLLFGAAAEDAGITSPAAPVAGAGEVRPATGDPRRAGLATGGAVLVRPDGQSASEPQSTPAGLRARSTCLYLIPANA